MPYIINLSCYAISFTVCIHASVVFQQLIPEPGCVVLPALQTNSYLIYYFYYFRIGSVILWHKFEHINQCSKIPSHTTCPKFLATAHERFLFIGPERIGVCRSG